MVVGARVVVGARRSKGVVGARRSKGVVGDGLVIPTVVVATAEVANAFNKNIGRKARGELGQLLTVM